MSIAYAKPLGPEVDHTIKGACSNCGECCADTLPLTPLDIQRIKVYIKKHHIEPVSHPLNHQWNPPIDSICPFFEPGASSGQHCLVYAVRPIICKHYLCKTYADPRLASTIGEAIFEEARLQPDVRRNPSIFFTPRSMRYAIWPEKFPEYAKTQLVFLPR